MDEPYSNPPWRAIDIDFNKKVAHKRENRKAKFVGLEFISSPTGNIIRVISPTFNIRYRGIKDLTKALFPADLTQYIIYDPVQLDLIVKSLGKLDAQYLVEDGVLHLRELTLWFTPGRSLTIYNQHETVKIIAINNWFRTDPLEKVLNDFNIPGKGVQGLSNLGLTLSYECKPIWETGYADIGSPSEITSLVLNRSYNKIQAGTIPEEVYETAYKCMHAPWIEMLQTGRFRDIYDYDLNAAYPTEVKNLLNIDSASGDWKFTHQWEPTAKYGFALAYVDIDPKAQVSPIMIRKNGGLYTGVGEWIGHITKDEIEFIYKYKLGRVRIISGWWFFPTIATKPFLKELNKFLGL